MEVHQTLFPEDDIDMLFPDPDDFGIHRVARGLIQGDTCNQANKSTSGVRERHSAHGHVVPA